MKIPIIIKDDLDKEVEQFFWALHNSNLPWLRNLVFIVFPELQQQLNMDNRMTKKEEKSIIKRFIIDFREENEGKINEIIKKSQRVLKQKSGQILKALVSLMDYQWPKDHPGYIIIPTILPHSPFGNNIYYYSMLGEIYEDKKNIHDILFLSAHEISHFILFDILNKHKKFLETEKLNWLVTHYLKEILASVLINQKPLSKLLKANNYLGNPDLRYIFVLVDHEKIQICQFFQKLYEKLKYKRDKRFVEIIKAIIKILLSIMPELEKRHLIWNKYGYQTLKNKIIFQKYSKPIKIKTDYFFKDVV